MADSVIQALIRVQGDPTGAVQALRTVQSEAKAVGATSIRVTEQVNRSNQQSLQELYRWAEVARQEIQKLDATPRAKTTGTLPSNVQKAQIRWHNELIETLQQIDKLENGIINTAYKMPGAISMWERLAQAIGSIGGGKNAGLQQFLQNIGQAVQNFGAMGQNLFRSVQSLSPYAQALGNLISKIPGIQRLAQALGTGFRGIGQIASSAAHAVGNVFSPALQKAGNLFKGLGTALTPALKSFTSLTAATTRAAAGFASLVRGMSPLISGLGKVASTAAKTVGSIVSIGKNATGAAFQSTGTHLAGMAVRLQGAQMGLYAMGGALNSVGQKGRQAFGDLLQVSGDYEQKITTLQNVLGKLGQSYSKSEFWNKGLELGTQTMYSPTQAVDVMTELVKAGLPADAVLKDATKATLDLSQATGEDLNVSIRAVVTSTTAWQGSNVTATEAADILTKGANASAASMQDLAGGLKNVAGVAPTLGVSLNDTVALLGALNNVGIKGPEAGTALRYFFLNLVPTQQKSIEMMKELGLMTMDMGRAAQFSGQQVGNQEEAMQALFEKWSGTKRSFQDAIDQEDPAVARFQTWLARNQIITSKFVDSKTGEIKNAAQVMDILWNAIGKDKTNVQRTQLASALFGQRGGAKGAGNLLEAYETNLKNFQSGAKDSKGNPLSLDANVVNAINKEMGSLGSASQVADSRVKTFAGSTARLQNTLEALKITMGGPLLNPLAAFINKVTDLIIRVRAWMEANPKVVESIGKLGLVLTGIGAVMGPLTMLGAAMPYIISGLRGVAIAMAPMGAVMLLIGGIVAAVALAFTDPKFGMTGALKGLGDVAQNFVPKALNFLGQVFNTVLLPIGMAIASAIRDFVIPALTKMGEWFSKSGPGIFQGFANFIQTVVAPAIYNLIGFLVQAIPVAVQFLSNVWNGILVPAFQFFAQIWENTLAPAFQKLFDWLSGFIPGAIAVVVEVWQNLLAPALEAVAGIIAEFVIPMVMAVGNWLGEILPPIISFLGYLLQQYIIPIIQKVAQFLGMIIPPVMGVVGAIAQFLIPVFRFVSDIIGPIILAILQYFIFQFQMVGEVVKFFAKLWNDNFLGIKSIAEWVGNAIVFVWNDVVGKIKQIIQWLIDAWNWLTGAAKQAGEDVVQATGEGAKQGWADVTGAVQQTADAVNKITKDGVKPAAKNGYDTGFGYGFNFNEALKSFMPAISGKIDWYRNQLASLSALAPLVPGIAQVVQGIKAAQGTGDIGVTDLAGLYKGATDLTGDNNTDQNTYDKQTDNRAGQPGSGGTTRTPAQQAADVAKTIADAIKAGIEALQKLAGLSVPKNLEEKAREFAEAVSKITMALQSVSLQFTDDDMKHTELFADTAAKAVDLVQKGVDSLKHIGDFKAPTDAAINTFTDAIKRVYTALQTVALTFSSDAITQTSIFADAAGKVTDLITKAVDGLAKLRDLVVPAQARFDEVAGGIKAMMLAVAPLAEEIGPVAQAQASDFADAAGKVADGLGKSTDLFVKLSTLETSLSGAEEKVRDVVSKSQSMMKDIQKMVTGDGTNPGWTPEQADLVGQFTDNVGKVADGLTKATDLFAKLNDPKTNIAGVAAKVYDLALHAHLMMNDLGDLIADHGPGKPGWNDRNAQSVGLFADNVGKVADGLGKAADLFQTLGDPKFVVKSVLDRVRSLVNESLAMMNYLGELWTQNPGWTPDNAQKVSAFAQAAGEVAKSLSDTYSFFEVLQKDGGRVDIKNLDGRVQELANAAQAMMAHIEPIAPLFEGKTEMIQSFSQSGAETAKALGETLDFFQKVAADKGKTEARNMADKVVELANALAQIMATMKKVMTDPDVAGIEDYAKSAAETSRALSDVFDLFTKLGGHYKLGSTSQLQSLAEALVSVVTEFQAALREAGYALSDTQVEAFTVAAELSSQIATIVDGLSTGLDMFAKLQDFKKDRKVNMALQIKELLDFIKEVVRQFREASKDFQDVDETTATLSKNIGDTVGGIGSALDTFEKLSTFRRVGSARISAFISDLKVMVDQMKSLPDLVGSDALDAAKEFGDKLGPAFDLMSKALDLFKAMMGDEEVDSKTKAVTYKNAFKPVDPAAVRAFIEQLRLLITTLRDGLLNQIAPELLDLSKDFGDKVGSAIDVLGKTLDIFLKMTPDEKGNGGLKVIDPDAIGALVGDLYLLLHHWRNVVIGGEFQGDFAERSANFSTMVEQVLDDVQRVLDLANAIAEANKEGAVDQLPEKIGKLADALRAVSMLTVPQIDGKVGEMFTNMTSKFNIWGTDITKYWNGLWLGPTGIVATVQKAMQQLQQLVSGLTTGTVTLTLNVNLAGVQGTGTLPGAAPPPGGVGTGGAGGAGPKGVSANTVNNFFNVRNANVNQVSDLSSRNRRLRSIQDNPS